MHPEFPLRDGLIYLNHAMASPWPVRTAEAVRAFVADQVHQGQAGFERWLAYEVELRMRLRRLLNADSVDDIAILKNTSEGLSAVAQGLNWQRGDNIVIPAGEFPSNRVVWEALSACGVEVRKAEIIGAEDPEAAIMDLADEDTRLIAVSSVQYATGLRLDLVRLGEFCRGYRIRFCIDAIQSLGVLPMNVEAIHADFVVAGSHKWLMGPEGTAVFWSRPEARAELQVRQYGWHMLEHALDFEREDWEMARSARRFEAGTMNSLGMIGLNASVSLLEETGLPNVSAAVAAKVRHLMDGLREIPGVQLVSDPRPERRSGIVTFRIDGMGPEAIHQVLKQAGVFCARRHGGIRLSPHFYTPEGHLTTTLAAVRRCVETS